MTKLPSDAVPRLARGVRLTEDKARNRWVIQAPERLFVPDETALRVLQLVDGARTLDGIVDELAQRFDAPRDVIAGDVTELLSDLIERKVVAT